MSTRKRSKSRERRDESKSSKLRMDSKAPIPRITDPSLPAGRRREIDTVMKKARASAHSNEYWDKKILEVEAKDPNRWRHSGYKSLYLDGSSSPSPSRRSRSRSPVGRRSPRSPPSRRSPIGRRSPRSPALRRSPVGRRSPRSPPSRRSPPVTRRSPPPPARSAKAVRPRSPRSPPIHKGRRSPSGSSVSSCSDDSCSVCSPKNHRHARSRSRSLSVSRSRKTGHVKQASPKIRTRPRPPSPSPIPRRVPRPMTPPPVRRPVKGPISDKPTDPRRQPPPPRPRNPSGKVINVAGIAPPAAVKKTIRKKEKLTEPVLLTRIKKERTKKRPGSPDSSGSEDSSTSSLSPIVATTRLTLSERFGKMAQWSIDRERRDIENMRITKNSSGGDLKVMIEEDDFLYCSPPRRYSHSPVPPGHYPDELLSAGPSGLASWDDVRVRYQYYKDLGYLRDLTLDDYVKWEEWWYKYQDWLANERHYEHWLSSQRRGKKRLPASQRLN